MFIFFMQEVPKVISVFYEGFIRTFLVTQDGDFTLQEILSHSRDFKSFKPRSYLFDTCLPEKAIIAKKSTTAGSKSGHSFIK